MTLFAELHGAILVNKHEGVSSFGIVEELQRELRTIGAAADPSAKLRRKDLPKMGHGGTLDPFATGLLVLCVGRGVKLARYFLGSTKTYEGIIRFGETTASGDHTNEVTERSEHLPSSLAEIQEAARKFTLAPYSQTPPMHSAKKKDGRPLYELAREGIEIEREPKVCQIYSFEILSYEKPHARFRVVCTAGTYIRTLSQDLARQLGTVAMLDTLHRSGSGIFRIEKACTVKQIAEASAAGRSWTELSAWVPFDQMLHGYDRAIATPAEALALIQGRQNVLVDILKRVEPSPLRQAHHSSEQPSTHIAIYSGDPSDALVAVACQTDCVWGLERVFTDSAS